MAIRIGPGVRAGLPILVCGVAMVSCVGVCVGFPCFPTGLRYGMWLDECPSTDMRLAATVQAINFVRGDSGAVTIRPEAWFLESQYLGASRETHPFRRGLGIELTLRDADGNDTEALTIDGWDSVDDEHFTKSHLSALPDGDYVLHAKLETAFDQAEIDLDVPLYTPSIPHVLSDRPLYKPGQDVLLRSVVLAATDNTPIAMRPGKWRIYDPQGNEMHLEKDKTDDWGIADTSFPLDARAEVGTWKVIFETGAERAEASFEVRPFRLPRFNVELTAAERWFSIGDELMVDGVARYSSGAPVRNATVSFRMLPSSGPWPQPLAWEEPLELTTDATGAFQANYGAVPADLMGRTTFQLMATVTDEAGESIAGQSTAILSKDDLKVDLLTELGDGLVEGFNNRAYLRVARPDDTPLRLTEIEVRNPWLPDEPVRSATTDADGVAALQIDPGAPVSVVIEPPPVRVRPQTSEQPRLSSGTELTDRRSLDLAERRVVDGALSGIAQCGKHVESGASVDSHALVAASGRVTVAQSGEGAVGRCVNEVTRSLVFPPGKPRMYTLTWRVPDIKKPTLSWNGRSVTGSDRVTALLADRLAPARVCLSRGPTGTNGASVLDVMWSVQKGNRNVQTSVRTQENTGLTASQTTCLKGVLGGLVLDEPPTANALGISTASLRVPSRPGSRRPSATTKTAYQLEVAAKGESGLLGTTRTIANPGVIPSLRARATPSLAAPGEEVTIELFRGPGFGGELPEKAQLMQGTTKLAEAKRGQDSNAYKFTIPDDARGFVHVQTHGARTVVYVAPADPLAVSVASDKEVYKPGETAVLTVTTAAGESGISAAVGLVGVDSALGQLAPLRGPDDLGKVTVRATSEKPAFGSFDPAALVLGQIRGANAAAAAVLTVSQLPMDAAGDRPVTVGASVRPSIQEDLITNFYRALGALTSKMAAWEASAADDAKVKPKQVSDLWLEVLAEQAKEGAPVVDGFGRELTLRRLPDDMLVQLDPRNLVTDGTHVPEDMIDWRAWVLKEIRP